MKATLQAPVTPQGAPAPAGRGGIHPLHASPRQVAQRARIAAAFGPALQLRAVQEDDEPVQATRQLKEGVHVHDDAGLVAQRRIHQWNGEAWKPGVPGKEGEHPLPVKPEGQARFFNDRTGQSAETAEPLADSLEHLAVQTGSVTEVMADGGSAMAAVEQELPALGQFAIDLEKKNLRVAREQALARMEQLNGEYTALKEAGKDLSKNEELFTKVEALAESLNQQIRRHDDPELVRGDSHTLYLGYFTFSAKDEAWTWDAGGDPCPEGAWKDRISTLLRNFMIANGQMAYIRSRKWYGQDTHKIEVDVNYYINRPFSTAPLYWHKDTGGGNLFVNLLFTNNQPIVGTEYTADTQAVGADKKSSLLANMPAEQVNDIEDTREKLKAHPLGKNIEIGTLPKKGYVAWVDELIWHSSPFLANRTPWSKELATAVLTDKVDPSTLFKVQTATTFEAMVLIARTPGTDLGRWVQEASEQPTMDDADGYWKGGYRVGHEEFGDSVLKDIAKVPWGTYKVNEAFGHEQDGSDPRVKPSPDAQVDDEGKQNPFTLVTPSGMVGRPRSASVAKTQQDMKAIVSGNEKGRNFLRTWVRIKPK